MEKAYKEAIAVAKERLADARKRGKTARGIAWDELEAKLFPTEKAAENARSAIAPAVAPLKQV